MEPLTHFLTGAAIGRAGLNRTSRYATLAAVLAAEAADLDMVWHWAGPVQELKHHRGITHTFVAVPLVAAACVGAVWLADRGLAAWRARKATANPMRTPQPIHWGWLYFSALIAALSHLLLDWTNNYGVRPFYPFNAHWYAGSFVFIAEPVLWALLLAALIVPWILGLADAEIGAKKAKFRGRGWAVFALVAMSLFWCWRWTEHARALSIMENAHLTDASIQRTAAEPYPGNPFRWHMIFETQDFYQTAEVNTRTGDVESDTNHDVLYKPPITAATEAAKKTELGCVYLDWGAWAVVRDAGPQAIPGVAPPQLAPGRAWTAVEFRDLRFGYNHLGAQASREHHVLAGWVYIVDGRDEAGTSLNGREQR